MNALTLLLIKSSLLATSKRRIRFDFAIMILGIVISVAVVVTAINLFEGYEITLKKILLSSSSHVLVYSDTGQSLSVQQAESAVSKLTQKPTVKTILPVYSNTAMIRLGSKIRSCLVRAYISFAEDIWYAQYVTDGSIAISSGTIILGDILARDLALNIGDSITLLYPQTTNLTSLGMIPQQQEFSVAAIVKTGYFEMDKTLIIMAAEDAYAFYQIEPQFTHLEINLNDKWIDRAAKLAAEYQNELGHEYKLYSWIDFNGNLFSLIVIEKWLIFMVFSFLILLAALNCVSIISTTILEKKREIAILKAIGLAVKQIRQVVYLRIMLICIISIILGLILGSILSWLITQQAFYQLKGDVYFIDQITMHISALNYLVIFTLALLLIGLCIKFPLRYINQMSVIDVLRGN